MPKATFQQISQEKRDRIVETAINLFAERGYNRTDVQEIARRAGIAKGSLYNYFESKEDLYLHICRVGLERSREVVFSGIHDDWDIYRQVDHIFRKGTAWVTDHPQYVRLYLNSSSAGMDHFAQALAPEVERHAAEHYKRVLRRGIDQGLVRADLDVDLAAFLINSLYIMLLLSLVAPHFKLRLRQYLDIPGEITHRSIEPHLDLLIEIMHRFLRPSGTEAAAHVDGPEGRAGHTEGQEG